MTDVRESLIAAGLFEENMSEKEMSEIYVTLKESEGTMGLGNSQPQTSPEDDFHLPELISGDKSNGNGKGTVKTCVDDGFDPVDCPPTLHKPLKILNRPLKYNPPLACNPDFQKLSFQEKFAKMYKHHQKLIKKMDLMQRRSIFPAPWGKPITCSTAKFNGTLLRKIEEVQPLDADEDEKIVDTIANIPVAFAEPVKEPEQRQWKRKLYSNDDETCSKKAKQPDSDIQSKIKHLSNVEIVRRSSIFSPRTPRTYEAPRSRGEDAFNKLMEAEKKKSAEEKRDEDFARTLDQLDSDEELEKEVVEKEDSDDDFQPKGKVTSRRIVPPRRGRNRRGRKNGPEVATSSKYQPLTPTRPASKEASEEKQETCPMCSKLFALSVIEEHAFTCGVPSIEANLITRKASKEEVQKCGYCHKEFDVSMLCKMHIATCSHNKK